MNKILNTVKSLSRRKKIFILLLVDLVMCLISWIIFGPPMSVLMASNYQIDLKTIISQNLLNFIVPCISVFIYFSISGFYRSSLRFSESKDLTIRSLNGALIFGSIWGLVYLLEFEVVRNQYSSIVILRAMLIAFVFYGSLQISRDIARILFYPNKLQVSGKPVLIYGAGAAGNELYHSIKNNKDIKIIGFFDNSNSLNGAEINNITIYGKDKHLKKLSEKYSNLEIYLAIPSLNLDERRSIISNLEKYKVAVRSIPSLHEIIADKKKMLEMQDLSIDDILTRESVKNDAISFNDCNVMVTGAGGSIGSEIVRQIIEGKPKKIILFEISEINLYSIQSEIENIKYTNQIQTEIIGVLGDVKNKTRLKEIILNHNIDHIYHAAAYKHVPIVEYHENISEGILNNVYGTKALCEVAKELKVKKVVVISTDKAVRPTNIMGASKRFSEMIVQSMDTETNDTKYCLVRFGNVINSSGSVVPLFRKQIANGGPLTITHKNVTRFFMTIAEASGLVIQAGEYAEGGDVFILDMGEQVRILELAERLIYLSGRNISSDGADEGIEIKEVGLRPGEKLYEELLISGKELKTANKKIYRSIEKFPKKEVLHAILNKLSASIEKNDIVNIRNIFKEHVEGFNDNNE
jgi:FlaA1/EpsC-like NDP-sugar epimerase